jgi:uncharacterized protein YjbI with pentapeptide repeats
MASQGLTERWRDPAFLAATQEAVEDVFVRKSATGADLRGVIVGLDGAPSTLLDVDLQAAQLSGVDFSYSRVSCSMVRGAFVDCRFGGVVFDTCRMVSARFVGCSLDQSKVDSPWMNDAVFEACSFEGATIIGRGAREYGGKRTLLLYQLYVRRRLV